MMLQPEPRVAPSAAPVRAFSLSPPQLLKASAERQHVSNPLVRALRKYRYM